MPSVLRRLPQQRGRAVGSTFGQAPKDAESLWRPSASNLAAEQHQPAAVAFDKLRVLRGLSFLVVNRIEITKAANLQGSLATHQPLEKDLG